MVLYFNSINAAVHMVFSLVVHDLSIVPYARNAISNRGLSLLLDAGANIVCRAHNIERFKSCSVRR
jgi:hypothetical protein